MTKGAAQAGADERRAQAACRDGSGVEVQDVNKLLKMHRQMADMMKKIGRQRAASARSSAWVEDVSAAARSGDAGADAEVAGSEVCRAGSLAEWVEAFSGLPPFPGGMPKLPGMGGGFSGRPEWARRNDTRDRNRTAETAWSCAKATMEPFAQFYADPELSRSLRRPPRRRLFRWRLAADR